MTQEYAAREYANATKECDSARARMCAASTGSKAWREAEEDLNFWQGKAANMRAAMEACHV